MKCVSTLLLLAAALAGCGGGSPLDNAATIDNPPGSGGRKLSFEYFQRCIQPLLLAPLATGNTCASAGCHDNVAGTGGALRVIPAAALVEPAGMTADAIHASAMYKNFYSAQGVTVIGQPSQSRLLTKPLVLNTLHGGGQVFASANDEAARRIAYWITRPMPEGQDEFSAAGNALFTPQDPRTGACNSQ